MEVPDKPDVVGWYKLSPTPGELGPSVMVGHLDWYNNQKGVFYNLNKLEIGDEVRIQREDGTVAVFRVSGKEAYDQNNFQGDKVYGAINHAGLRLITCMGDFLRSEGHYSENLVVYADLVDSEN